MSKLKTIPSNPQVYIVTDRFSLLLLPLFGPFSCCWFCYRIEIDLFICVWTYKELKLKRKPTTGLKRRQIKVIQLINSDKSHNKERFYLRNWTTTTETLKEFNAPLTELSMEN